jgi:hypothetical protein
MRAASSKTLLAPRQHYNNNHPRSSASVLLKGEEKPKRLKKLSGMG